MTYKILKILHSYNKRCETKNIFSAVISLLLDLQQHFSVILNYLQAKLTCQNLKTVLEIKYYT